MISWMYLNDEYGWPPDPEGPPKKPCQRHHVLCGSPHRLQNTRARRGTKKHNTPKHRKKTTRSQKKPHTYRRRCSSTCPPSSTCPACRSRPSWTGPRRRAPPSSPCSGPRTAGRASARARRPGSPARAGSSRCTPRRTRAWASGEEASQLRVEKEGWYGAYPSSSMAIACCCPHAISVILRSARPLTRTVRIYASENEGEGRAGVLTWFRLIVERRLSRRDDSLARLTVCELSLFFTTEGEYFAES